MKLFSTIDEVQEYVSVAKSFKIDSLKSSLETIERSEIKKILGTTLFNSIADAYDASLGKTTTVVAMNEEMAALLHESRRPLAYLALAAHIPFASVIITDTGIQQTQDGNLISATKWRTDALIKELNESGNNKLDELFEFLEENSGDYSDWKTSDEYSIAKELFVFNTKVFNRWYGINNSRRVYISLKPQLLQSEIESIKPLIRKPTFDLIKTQIIAGTLSTPNKYILENYIQPVVINLAMSKAFIDKSAMLDENGVTVFKTLNTDAFTERDNASDARTNQIAINLKERAEGILENLRLYLIENISDFPLLLMDSSFSLESTQVINSPENKSFRAL